jgi:signal peptidase I
VTAGTGDQPVGSEPGQGPAEETSDTTPHVEWANSLAGRVGQKTAEPPAEGVGAPPEAAEAAPSGAETGKHHERKGPLGFLKELPALLLIAFVLALLIKTFLVQAFYIPSESMVPTLNVGDRVLVNKVVYHLHPPRRGDIIVFADPHPTEVIHRNAPAAFIHWLVDGLGVQKDPTKDFIKRVVGLPGETVQLAHCQVLINGQALTEPYLTRTSDCSTYGPVKVPFDSLFVMGDNRPNSNDSRGTLGFIPYDKVIGRAFIIIWPPSRFGWLHGL